MSGIVGLCNRTGIDIDRGLLDVMTGALRFRGPDKSGVWSEGPVGFGHTLLRTTDEAEHERQPLSLDGRVWIVADARVDDRDRLVRDLAAAGRSTTLAVPDIELILHAYHAWQDGCVDRLLGDFAFAVWDSERRRLFCARDPLGVKSFYYAPTERALVFSNTLNCVRQHPDVSATLDDADIVDYLVFNYHKDRERTAFADIKRLPGGHVLVCDAGRVETRRYWDGPREGRIRYRRREDYVEHFRALHRRAVADRLRTRRVVVSMTGGMDSSSIAAAACEVLRERGIDDGVIAHTIVYDRLFADRERYYAGLVAEHLRIPIRYLVADDYTLYGRRDDPALRRPEPVDEPFTALHVDFRRAALADSRVLLTGADGDAFLAEHTNSHMVALLRRGHLAEFVRATYEHMRTWHRPPPLRVRTTLYRWLRGSGLPYELPAWLQPTMRERFQVDARWAEWAASVGRVPTGAPLHPRLHKTLQAPFWPHLFDVRDAGGLGVPLEFRFPLMDLRVIEYLAAIPVVPWCQQKHVLRLAMRGRLPDEILSRPKAPLAANPDEEVASRDGLACVDDFVPEEELSRYVVRERIPRAGAPGSGFVRYMDTRPFSLNEWLCYARRSGESDDAESRGQIDTQGVQEAGAEGLRNHPGDHLGNRDWPDHAGRRAGDARQDRHVASGPVFHYRAHGLRVSADVEIPGLVEERSHTDADLRIWANQRPFPGLDPVPSEPWYETAYRTDSGLPILTATRLFDGRYYHIAYRDGVEFTISRDADQIWVHWPEGLGFRDTVSYLLGPILGVVLRLRGVCCLHGSCVALGEGAVGFVGSEGAGKSTLAAGFAMRGYAILSDDTIALQEHRGRWLAPPGYPRVRLWSDSAAHVSSRQGASCLVPPQTNGSTGRYHLNLTADGYRFASEPVALTAVYVLGGSPTGMTTIEHLSPAAGLMALVRNTFATRVLDRQLRALEFEALGRFVVDVPIYRLLRGSQLDRLDDLCAAVLEHVSAQGAALASAASAR